MVSDAETPALYLRPLGLAVRSEREPRELWKAWLWEQGATTGLIWLTPRPNGPAEYSPGLRPKADALGGKATRRGGLKGRKRSFRVGADSIRPGSRDPSGRLVCGAWGPRASAFGLGPGLESRDPSGRKARVPATLVGLPQE